MPTSNLVEPFAVVIEDVDALVADGAVLRSLRRDGDVAEVAPTILDHVQVLRTVQLRNRFFGRNLSKLRIGRVDQQRSEVEDEVDAVQDGVQHVEGRLEAEQGVDENKIVS